jgi:hypothetical protein
MLHALLFPDAHSAGRFSVALLLIRIGSRFFRAALNTLSALAM